MINYTVGLLFSENRDNVILINKTKPEWQRGKLNGVGGKMENNETPSQCIEREFEEEAGLKISNWELFTTLTDNQNWTVFFFRSFTPFDNLLKCQSMTKEKIQICDISAREWPTNLIENLTWMIPLALSKDDGIPLFIMQKCECIEKNN